LPLYPNAKDLLRANLERAATWWATERAARRPLPVVKVGTLSPEQLAQMNEQRQEEELEPVLAEILFDGRHMYESRCLEDGYTIDDVLEMIETAFKDTSQVGPGWGTALISATTRVNAEGITVRDELVFECHNKRPYPELRSVIPRGDGKDHSKKKKATR
jgi:hypothetical protein